MGTYSAAGASGTGAATWSLSGTDASDLSIDRNSGVLTFNAAPNFEAKAMYRVTVTARVGSETESADVTITVTNEDEPGRVTFWRDGADATTAAIMVGDMLGGLAEDPDGNVGDTPPITDMYPDITGATWQWAKSMTPDMMDSWMDIGTGGMYTVMDDDAGHYLRATATYTDGEGMDKMASEKTMKVGAMAGDPLLTEYDPNGDGVIEKADMRKAVGKFFKDPPDLTREEMRRLVAIFFSS